MTDIARAAGVSQTTVSLVLNAVEKARVSAETRTKVQRAAERLGYLLPRRSGGLSPRGDLATIGVMVDQLSTDPWMAIAIDGARERAWERAVALQVVVTGGDAEVERAIVAQWRHLSLLGVIYGTINTRGIATPPLVPDVPTILLNCTVADHALPSIVPGEVAGGHTATEHLIRAGHRRIAFIGGEPWMTASRDRLKGYRQALATWDLPFDAKLVRHGDWQPSSGYRHAHDLVAASRRPTAIFCANDLMAMGCFEALKERGLRIPDDVAVIGYDDRDIAQHLHPPLTTILLPHHEMGVTAADYLLETRPPGRARADQLKLECPLVERASVRSL